MWRLRKSARSRFGQGERVDAVEADGAGRRPVERAEDVQQRALAGAGRPHDGEGLAALQVEADVAQHRQRAAAGGVVLGEVGDVERHRRRGLEGRGGRAAPTAGVVSLYEVGRQKGAAVGQADETTKPLRSIRLVRSPAGDGVGVFLRDAARRATFYTLHEMRCDIGGRGFAVHRLGVGNLYHIRVGEPADCSCECLGFLRYGKCRHVLGLLALIREGML